MKKMAIIMLAMILILTPFWAIAQEKAPGQAQEHEKQHSSTQGQQPQQQPIPGPGMMGGQVMMCPFMLIPQMVQHMQKMMPLMEQIVKEKKMNPQATKEMQDMMKQMQDMMKQTQTMMTQMQGMMTKMQNIPMMQMMPPQQQTAPPPPKK